MCFATGYASCGEGCVWVRVAAPRKPAICRVLAVTLDLVVLTLAQEQWRTCCPPKGLGGLIHAHLYAPDPRSKTTVVLDGETQKHK